MPPVPLRRVLLLLPLLGAACSGGETSSPAPPAPAAPAAPAPSLPAGPLVPRFTDVTAESGVDFTSRPRADLLGYGQAVAAADVDGDGDIDLFLSQEEGPCALYRNDGGLRFTEVAAAAGVRGADAAHAKAAAFLDFDRDGDPDLFVGTTGEGNRLLRNRGDGTFEDVTAAAGVGGGNPFTLSAVPGDCDGDGWTDLYEANAPPVDYRGTLAPTGGPATNRLWRNNGDGTFADVAPALRVDDPLATWAAHWFDLDGDGDQDLLVANDHFFYPHRPTRDRAYVNGGAAAGFAFEDRAEAWGLDENHSGMGFVVADLDGDGAFDIYTPDYGPNEVRFGGDPPPRRDRAMETAISDDDAGSLHPAISWGCAAEDFDGDGWNDLLVFRGSLLSKDPGGPGAARQRPCLWLSRPDPSAAPGGRRFVASAKEAGLADLRCPGARGVVPCDLDGDGDLDLALATRFGKARILRNDTPRAGPWYGVRLRGERSPREGWGAVLELRAGGRTLRRLCTPGGQTGVTLPPEWILVPGPGAGEARLTVRWPSGTVQEAVPAAGAWTTVRETR